MGKITVWSLTLPRLEDISQLSLLKNDIYYFIESLWDKIERDVPKGEKNSIFLFLGNDYLRGIAFDWSGSKSFGIRRGITDEDDFPIVTNRKIIKRLLCEDGVECPSVGKWSVQKERIPISHLHAWELNKGVLTNVSQ